MRETIAPVQQLDWTQALAWRMHQHHLAERAKPAELIQVVRDICGLHAQLMSSAELSLWARIDGLERDAMQKALWEHRSLVKLWAIRGTLHLLAVEELGLWLSAFGAYTHLGNTHAETDILADAVAQALDGRWLTREELAVEVEQATGLPEFGKRVRFSWGSYLKAVSFRGLLCLAPSDGNLVRFTTPATWVPGEVEEPAPDDALREVTRRALSAYAPLTPTDLARWWLGGAGPARGATMLRELGNEAVEVDVEGEPHWVLARDVPGMVAATIPNTVRLLPAFDPWVIGASRTAASQIEVEHRERVYRKQGWISPVVLVNGQMAGVWKHEAKNDQLRVEIESFRKLPSWAVSQVEAEAERLAAFFKIGLNFRYSTGNRTSRLYS